jgi:translation initiation factor 2B subunit (eIF-2B alpha/beta/delta family)
MPPQLDAAGQPLQATVLITPVLSAIADAVGSRAAPVAPSTPSQDADAKGPLGGPGEADALLQQVYNPSFDVTPAELIAAVVTEKGVAVKADGHEEFALRESGVV